MVIGSLSGTNNWLNYYYRVLILLIVYFIMRNQKSINIHSFTMSRNIPKVNYNLDLMEMKTSIPFQPYDPLTPAQIKKLPANEEPIDRIYVPQMIDNMVWVQVDVTGKMRPKFITPRAAVHLYPGNALRKSFIAFVNDYINHESITNQIWRQLEKELYIKVKPQFSKGDYCILIRNDLPLGIQLVRIKSIARNRTVLFNQVDSYKLYNIGHIDPRQEQVTYFTKESGAEFGLTTPSGAVEESALIRISSEILIGDKDYGYIEAQNYYLRLKNESLLSMIQTATNLCHTTVRQFIQSISQRIRARCIRINEGKIWTDSYVLPGSIQIAILLPKFASLKGLNSYNIFPTKGESTYCVFDCESASQIYQSENLNRDFNEEGTELFNDAKTEMDDVDFTMAVSSVVHRLIPAQNKCIVKYNICRSQTYEHGDDKIFGVTEEWKNIEALKTRKRKRKETDETANQQNENKRPRH
eukprot:85029_1